MKNTRLKKFTGGILFLAVILFIAFSAYAEIPKTITNQGYLTGLGGDPVNGAVQMTFSIYDVNAGGTALWGEAQNVSVNNGLYSVILGSVRPIDLAFETQYYLGVTVGADAEMTPRQALTSVPYAMRAKVADDNVKKTGDEMTGTLTISAGVGHALVATTTGTGSALEVENSGSGYAAEFRGKVWLSNDLELINGNLQVAGNIEAPSAIANLGHINAGEINTTNLTAGESIYATQLYVSGTKHFVQPHPKDPSKELVYVSMEGPESAIFLRGKARLVKGKATIETPEYFKMVAGENDITVQFTPRSSKSKGLAATKVTKDKVGVSELMNGKGTYEFDYFITAKRAGFEKHEPIQPNTHFTADMSTKEESEKKYSKTDDMAVLAIRNLLISNGILTKDGTLNMEMVEKLGWKLKESDVAKVGK